MVLYIGIYIESDWLYHAEWVALSNGQSGSDLVEYSNTLFFVPCINSKHFHVAFPLLNFHSTKKVMY